MSMRKAVLLALTPLMLHAQMRQPLLPFVNPLVGTAPSATRATLAHGQGTEALANTIPSVTYPWGMTQWVAQTRFSETKCVAPYYYGDTLFSGFRGSHWISGSCMQDYGSVTVTAITGTLQPEDPGAAFTHASETATPAYYRVDLLQRGLRAEVTATARCGFIRFTALRDDSVYILIHPNSDRGLATLHIDGPQGIVTGSNPVYRIYQGSGQPAGFDGCFAVRFPTGSPSAKVLRAVAYVGYKLKAGQSIQLKVGTSFTSEAGAVHNLTAEIPGWNFNEVVAAARQTWEQELSRISIEVMADSVRRIFYTAMYHAMQQPRLYNDVDGTYPMFASSHKTARLSPGSAYYDDFSMWDIYRAQVPLIEILKPDLAADLVHSLLLKAQQGGWLPAFPCWNSYTAAMVGNHANAVIASALARGIPFDREAAYRFMRKDAFAQPDAVAYRDGRGRRSLSPYLALGYYPLEEPVDEAFHKNEQVSRTLEYAYDDYCIAQLAKAAKQQQDYDTLMRRARNYVHVFDTATGFMNGRHTDGRFYPLSDPDARLYFVTEGTPRQYTFYVPQDMTGLTGLLGGRSRLAAALDSLFDKGQYWHGNEPDQQTPFLYDYTDQPYRSTQRVHTVLEEEYANRPGGLCGNDDAGQISAWYILGALGLYPVDPASGDYAVCLPLVRAATLHLPGGKTFRIIVRSAGPAYTLMLNGQPHPSFFLSHAELQRGGVLEFRQND